MLIFSVPSSQTQMNLTKCKFPNQKQFVRFFTRHMIWPISARSRSEFYFDAKHMGSLVASQSNKSRLNFCGFVTSDRIIQTFVFGGKFENTSSASCLLVFSVLLKRHNSYSMHSTIFPHWPWIPSWNGCQILFWLLLLLYTQCPHRVHTIRQWNASFCIFDQFNREIAGCLCCGLTQLCNSEMWD